MRGEHTVGGGGQVNAPASKVRLAPGGGGGGWIGGPRTASSDNYNADDAAPQATGTSIFDPVLCELAYRWFCPLGGMVADPFAGGSVRGIVAAALGYHYTGFELRGEQVDANAIQAARICQGPVYPQVDNGRQLGAIARVGRPSRFRL